MDLITVDGLELDQRLRHRMQLVDVFVQDACRPLIVAVDERPHLLVDCMRRVVGQRLVLRDRASEEYLALVLAVGQRPHAVGQPPLRHHVSRDLCRAHDVVRSTRRHGLRAKYHLLCNTATEQAGDLALEVLLAVAVAVLFGEEHGHAQRPATRNDRHLVHGVVGRHLETDNRMSGLVIGSQALFLLLHDHRLALGAHHDLVLGLLHILHIDQALVGPCRKQRGLVDQVGEISPGKARRAARDDRWFDTVVQRHLPHMDLEYLLPAQDIGQADDHLAVETPRTQQRRIEDVRAVGRGDDDHALVALESVHLDQQLI